MKIRQLLTMLFGLVALQTCNDNDSGLNDGNPPTIPIGYPSIDSYPAWSPDGMRIIYNHYGITGFSSGMILINPDSSGLWMMNADGSNHHLVLRGFDIYPAWSADGRWIVFHQGGQIFKIPVLGDSLDKSRVEQLTSQGENFLPAWSPDGQWITYDSNSDSPNGMNFIWKMKADGSQKRRIAYAPTTGETRMPNWSPNGNQIVHKRYIGVGPEIFTMDTSGNNPIRLTYNNNFDNYPKYSPDGTKITFESNANVWIMNADGRDPRQLTIKGGKSPSWSPDGTKIVYIGFINPKQQYNPRSDATVWVMNTDGSNKRQLTYGPAQE